MLAAIEADRPLDTKQHLAALDLAPHQHRIAGLRAELSALIEQAEHAGA